jgi:hypothetical protein
MMSDDIDDTINALGARLAALEERVRGQDRAKRAVENLIALATDPRAAKRVLRSIHDSLVAEAEAQKKTRDEREAFEEWKALETADIAPLRKSAENAWVHAKAKEAAVEARERAVELREQRCRELGLDISSPAVHHTRDVHPDFQPIAGTTIVREPERLFSADNEPPPAPIRRGEGDSGDWPPNVTLTRQPEPAAGARIRGRKNSAPPGPEAA